jgi:epoxyqueuosine reductase
VPRGPREPEKRVLFAREPDAFILKALTRFLEESRWNRRKADGGRYFTAPLVGFASGDDPLFDEYQAIIGDYHLTPRTVFDLTFGKGDDRPLTVISWVLPVSEDTRRSNRKDGIPSLLWSHTRYFGEPCNDKVREHLLSVLTRKGYRAVAPAISPHFIHRMHVPGIGFTSNWSERHIAYACGLGTFGLCDGFITPKGKAMRLGSVVTDLILPPSGKPFDHHHANCLYFFNGTCKACAGRCPAGAITERGHDKDVCLDFQHNVLIPAKGEEYGVRITGCGLCQTKVPCEYEIPRAIQKERTKTGKAG